MVESLPVDSATWVRFPGRSGKIFSLYNKRVRKSKVGSGKSSKKAYDIQLYPREESKEEGKDQESIQSSTTPDPGHHMGKRQRERINITYT